jgi:hypothetical protein
LTVAGLLVTGSSSLHAQVYVTTYHNDNSRTGQNTAETALTTLNVNSGQFGKLFSQTVDGYVYAQPLYVPNLTIGGTPHNVVFVATEHDSVYAFDADSNAGANATWLWHTSFINPPSVTTVNSSSDANCGDLVPEIGITSTPVIDTTNNTMYLTAKTKESGVFHLRLHALDITTGLEKFGGPIDIQGTVSGSEGGTPYSVTYNPLLEAQRPGLLLLNGHVYVATASHCDNGPYHGWVFDYIVGASPMVQNSIWVAAPNGSDSGIWMAGSGPAADTSGNVYFATGNGTWDGTTNYGDSIVKLSTTSGLALNDYFTAYNQQSLSDADSDLGSGGVVLLPPQSGAHANELVESGKEGTIYVVDIDPAQMGHWQSGSDSQIVQSVIGQIQGTWSTPAYWNGNLYFGGASDGGNGDMLKAFSVSGGMLSSTPTSETSLTYQFPGPTVSVSSNGNNNGIVWALQNEGYSSNTPSVLHGYDATNLATELYNSNQVSARDGLGLPVKFSVPTVANGKVYVGTQAAINVFGIISALPQAPAPTIAPFGGTYDAATTVTLSSTISGATIYYTTNGAAPTISSPVYKGPIAVSSTETVRALAVAAGYQNSAAALATFTIVGPGATVNYGNGFSSNGLTLNGNATFNGSRLRLTDGGTNEASSVFASTPISVQNFTTDFVFQMTSATADGFTFTIQNDAVTALGSSGAGLGYGPDPSVHGGSSIPKSVAIKFDLYDNGGANANSTGFYAKGSTPIGHDTVLTPSGITLGSGDTFDAHLSYDGTTLRMTLTDLNTGSTFRGGFTANIPNYLGSSTAWVGFTAGTGDLTAIQDILSWTFVSSYSQATPAPGFSVNPGSFFSPVTVSILDTNRSAKFYYTLDGTTPTTSSNQYSTPLTFSATTRLRAIAVAPGLAASQVVSATYTIKTPTVNYGSGFTSSGVQLNGNSTLNGTRLRLTDGNGNEASSAFYTTPVTISEFTTNFTFQLTSANADGMAFVIQNVGTTALGGSGGALGYAGINNSVAVKFDLYDNAGEGTDSTGLFTDGANPYTPAEDMTSSGVNLHSGDTMSVQMTYNGTTLTMTISDTVTRKSFTYSWAVNIPSVVGGNTAYIGFTGGTGGETAIQDVVTWQFGN